MPFDCCPDYNRPSERTCPSCKRPIAVHEPVAHIRFDPDPVHRLEEMNGAYHADCAKPYLSIARALEMLRRPWVG